MTSDQKTKIYVLLFPLLFSRLLARGPAVTLAAADEQKKIDFAKTAVYYKIILGVACSMQI